MIEKKFIRDLKEKEHFHTCFHVLDKTLGQDRNGKSYMSLQLSDATGAINARIFERVDELSPCFQSGDFIAMKGFVQSYQGRLQVVGQEIQKAQTGEFEIKDLIRSAAGDIGDLQKRLQAKIVSVQDKWIRGVLERTVNEEPVASALLRAPAAKSIHHAYLGGLLDHIVSILDVLEGLSKHYTFLNRDLLIFGGVYHDIGKISELEYDHGIHYTDRGRLVGHMGLACEMIDEKAGEMDGFPEELKDILKHIVLSHHGKLEYGSPKLPMLAEAVVVAMIDDLDSKLNTISQFLSSESSQLPSGEKWTRYHPGFERYFYLGFFRK